MKNSVLAVVAGMFLFGCGGEETNSAKISQKEFAASTWFGGLSQGERNQRILERAYSYNGQYNQCNCKEWARDVVQEASYNQANIPSTCPDWSGWYWCPWWDDDVYEIPMSYAIYYAHPGNIVQMRTPDQYGNMGPHTAIVWAKWSSGVCFIDANYVYNCKVGIHCESLSSFVSKAPLHTVYVITGN